MNVWARGRFWSLRPQVTARRLELACWIAILALSAALISATGSAPVPASPSSEPISILDAQPTPTGSTTYAAGLAAYYQSRCVKRVIALTSTWPDLDVGKQIQRQCMMPRQRPTSTGQPPARVPACMEGFVWRPAIASVRAAGCSLG